MQTDAVELLAFGAEHLEGAVRLSRQAQWPHRLADWQMALALSRGYAALAKGSRLVGTVLVTPYKNELATLNMVIVDENERGRGLGRRLMGAALALAGSCPLRLVATREGLPLYEKLGFAETGGVIQHQGVATSVTAPEGVHPSAPADIAAITELDRQAFGADRDNLIASIAKIGSFAVLHRAGSVSGFAALRPFGRGEVIGPVVAADLEEAKALVSYFMAARAGRFLRIDVDVKGGLGPWLAEQGLPQVGGGVLMQRPVITPAPAARVFTFALASQAFG